MHGRGIQCRIDKISVTVVEKIVDQASARCADDLCIGKFLEELSAYACSLGKCNDPGSGSQEYLQSALNSILFGE